MKITLTMHTENAAFDGPNAQAEVARILRDLAERTEVFGLESRNVLDVNGNKVGRFTIEETE